MLVAIFGEKQSQAVYLLGLQDVARLDVVNFVSHGVPKIQDGKGREPRDEASCRRRARRREPARALYDQPQRAAEAGKIDPLIGRQLRSSAPCRSSAAGRKNNPLFVGEPGVGKTALAEGLARLIVEGKMPDFFGSARSTRSTWAR